MANIGAKISALMTQKKISAVQIEEETGLNKNTIYSITAGNSKNPSAYNLQLIAKALGVTLESILIDKNEIQTNSLSKKQLKVFADATNIVIHTIIQKELNFTLDNLTSIIKEIYQYALKVDPPSIENRFVEWLLEQYKD